MSVNSKMTAIADAIRNLLDISGTMGLDAMASNISSITKRGAVTGTISTKSERYTIPAGYHNGIGTVEISPGEQAKLIAENIKNGVTILGVAGSASGEIFSIIAVTYPAGSICTCGGKAAKDTSGYALFNVKAGTYTVECHTSDNSQSKSTSVTVAESDAGKSIPVTLTYELVLFESGTGAMVELETYHDTYGTISITDDAITIGKTQGINCEVTVRSVVLDLSEYNTLEVIINVSSIISDYPHNIGVIFETTNPLRGSEYFDFISYQTISNKGEQTINIPVSSIDRGHFAMGGFIYGTVSSIRFIP